MKRTFAFIAFAMSALFVMAEGHMTFKGVEINGSVSSVVKQLEEKEFTKISEEKGMAMMYGKFTGQDVGLGIYATPVSKTVSRIGVIYPNESDTWTLVSSQYEGLKERLTKKYGEPTEVIEKFQYPYSENSHPLIAFKLEKAEYKTRFEAENGGVTLSILYNQGQTVVVLLYWDKENEAKMESELEDEL